MKKVSVSFFEVVVSCEVAESEVMEPEGFTSTPEGRAAFVKMTIENALYAVESFALRNLKIEVK